ncbi:MAG: tetratricopeptide repeat protein [Pirellulales bacterium]|nr:tetratricopeptide repeat protein [Pirellulales bacterium]
MDTIEMQMWNRAHRRAACLAALALVATFAGCASFDSLGAGGPLAGIGRSRYQGFGERFAEARRLEMAGKLDEARPIYEKLIVDYPKRAEAFHRLGVVADLQRRHREAVNLYSQAITLSATDPELFNDLGYCLYLQGQLDKAESALLKAVSMAPSNGKYHNNLGLVYGHQRRYEDALKEFRKAGSDASAQYNLAFVLATQNDMAGAKRCFELALRQDPTFEKARSALDSFERFERDPEGFADFGELVQDGVRWVPYIEGGQPSASQSGAQLAAAALPVATTTSAASANNATQPAESAAPSVDSKTAALQHRAQALLRERLSAMP